MSSIVNKIKEAVHDKKSSSSSSAPEGTHGTHNSRAANAADPRIDSDRDGSRHVGHNTEGYGQTGSNYEQDSFNTRNNEHGRSTGHTSHTTGTHRSDAMNKADPRIDSDRDGSRNMGMSHNQPREYGTDSGATAGGMTGSSGLGSSGRHQQTEGMGMGGLASDSTEGTYGSSRHQHSEGMGGHHSGATEGAYGSSRHQQTEGLGGHHSGGASEGTYGTHNSRAANAADPRIDSDRDGSRTYGGLESTGPASKTAGPHKSDMMNKADPRVDSNLDGSKTYGGDKTYAQSNTRSDLGSEQRKNPLDAAQVPPSVMRKYRGEVEITHDDEDHNRERRHSVVTHQENHMMGNVA